MSCEVYIAISQSEMEGDDKQWAVHLRILDAFKHEKERYVVQGTGSGDQFRIEHHPADSERPEDQVEYIYCSTLLGDDIKAVVIQLAEATQLRNHEDTYDCQDFVYDLIRAIGHTYAPAGFLETRCEAFLHDSNRQRLRENAKEP